MDVENFTIPTFGRFNWNISREFSITLGDILKWINIIGAVFEFTVIFVLVVNFFKKKSGFREPYFIIYANGCFVDAMTKILRFVHSYTGNNIVISLPLSFFNWYNGNFITFWNFLLALNRFIAIVFSLNFSKIWSKKKGNTTFVILFLLIYPFLIHCFNPSLMWCQIIGIYCPRSFGISTKITDFEIYFSNISDILYAILATILCFIATLNIAIKKRAKNQKVETVLLIQSFTSSVFLILSKATSWLAGANGAFSLIIPPAQTRSSAAYLSELQRSLSLERKNFRTKYLEFYKVTSLLKHFKKAMKKETGATITVVPQASNNTTPRIAHIASTFLH